MWIVGLLGPAPRPGREWVGWLSILFFGLGAILGSVRLFDRQTQIVVDRHGFLWRRWGDQTIPWAEIRRIEARRIKRQPFLCIYLKDPSKFPASGWTAGLAGLNTRLGFGDIAVSTAGTDIRHDELVAAIKRFAPPETLPA